jgi:hypothetical protein
MEFKMPEGYGDLNFGFHLESCVDYRKLKSVK